MSLAGGLLAFYMTAAVVPAALVLIFLARRLKSAIQLPSYGNDDLPRVPVEILVPVKGVSPCHEVSLRSLLEQDYAPYLVTFILESPHDPASSLVDELRSEYSIARKVISGISESCAQKNHSLVEGVKALQPETEILVFCDSTNEAESQWLKDFTAPLRAGDAQVVTTFRAFDPRPETIAGMCQALYASSIVVLNAMKKSPWGGATGIQRNVFESLRVVDTWSRTVVDDLVLGNVLRQAGVEVHFDPRHLLKTPLHGQTYRGLLSYLDRQILFPKFTNPGMWLSSLFCSVNLTMGMLAALCAAALYVLGYSGPLLGCASAVSLGVGVIAGLSLRSLSPLKLSASRWLISMIPLLVLGSFVFLRSIFVNSIEWHGTKYYPGNSGVVLRVGRLGSDHACS